jgi:hypothetical protein
VDLNRLTLGARIIGIAGLLLFIDSFLPWFRTCVSLFGSTACGGESGWGTPLSLLGILIGLAMVVFIVAEATGNAPSSPGTLSWGQVLLGAGGLTFAFVLLQIIIGDHGLGRSYGAYIGLVLSAALAYGGYLRSREAAPRAS